MEVVALLLVVGGAIVAVASGFQTYLQLTDSTRRRPVIMAIFVIAVVQTGLHCGQYYNVHYIKDEEQKKVERETACALWAYTEGLGKYLEDLAGDEPYLLGYFYFKKGEYEEAKYYLKLAITRERYKAPAHFILAVILRLESGDEGDLSPAAEQLRQGLQYDSEYSSLYLERGKHHLIARSAKAGLSDISTAIRRNPTHCYDINERDLERESYWKLVENESEFEDIVKRCAEKWPTELGLLAWQGNGTSLNQPGRN